MPGPEAGSHRDQQRYGHGNQDGVRVITLIRDVSALRAVPVIGGKLGISGPDGGAAAKLLTATGFDAVFDDEHDQIDAFRSFVMAETPASRGELVVQPRMGFSDPQAMRAGLLATKSASAKTAGTITLDSYTRTGNLDAARNALAAGNPLNGYPITTYPAEITQSVLDGIQGEEFPVQVRHGSAVTVVPPGL